jgi:predicted DNA-binding transcriptional regulator AlpA
MPQTMAPWAGLTIADVAQLAGVTHSTLRAYLAREQMPQPSGRIGRTPYWMPETIQPWLDARASREQVQ